MEAIEVEDMEEQWTEVIAIMIEIEDMAAKWEDMEVAWEEATEVIMTDLVVTLEAMVIMIEIEDMEVA